MNAEIIFDAMQDIDDRFLDMANAPKKEIIQMKKAKTLTRIFVIAAVVALLAVTAYASDFLQVRSLISTTSKSYSVYSELEQAMKQAGFEMDAKETFANGFTFQRVRVEDVDGMDENGQTVMSTKEIAVYYQNSDGMMVILHAVPDMEELPETPTAGITQEIAGITVTYVQDHYRFVPEDYELTEEDKLWQEQPGNYISYGADEVNERTVAYVKWEKDGLRYSIMEMSAQLDSYALFNMAQELIG